MKEFLAFLLPPATAFAGMRISRLILGRKIDEQFGFGLRLGLGFAVGMVVFSQLVLLTALAGVNATSVLAWVALIWGAAEAFLHTPKLAATIKQTKFHPGYLWLLLLLPVFYAWWVFGMLSTLEGTLEFDANAFWVFKSKILYLTQGKQLIDVFHQGSLAYAHLDYPMLVPCLYTFGYGLVGGVNEFVNKVWPFWMMVMLTFTVLSIARTWRRPHPLPILAAVLVSFLPATLQFVRQEGGTLPMLFCTSLAALLMTKALAEENEIALVGGILSLTMCATTKFEGVIYTALWGTVAIVFCWRKGWLKNRLLWKTLAFAAICLVPYAGLRLIKPVPHPESGWIHDGMASPATALHRFPQTLSLSLGARFFNPQFFNWTTADKNHVAFAGKWDGLKSAINPELSVLPWVLLILFALSLWALRKQRFPLITLAVVLLAQVTILSFVISCLARMQADVSNVIDFAISVVGRYYYPFFAASFLGVIALWFLDKSPEASPSSNLEPQPVSATKQSPAPKRR